MERRSPGGRPTRDEATRRDERILDVASALFFRSGFDATSIDSIAAAASVGKPSLYARYGDKTGLCLAVLRRTLDRCVKAFPETGPQPETRLRRAELESNLTEFGLHILEASITPDAISLGRLLASECGRFPELAQILHEEGWMRGVRHVAALLRSAVDFEHSDVDDPELAADLFLSLVLGRMSRQAMLGIVIDKQSLDGRVAAAVKVFLGTALRLH